MNRLSRSFAVAVALALALGAGAWASPERGHPSRPSLERAVEALGLDDATAAKVDAILDAARPAKRELFRSLREEHQAMRALLEDAGSAEAAVLARADAVGRLHTELRKHELQTLFQVRAQLSPEQRQQLAAALERGLTGKGCSERSHGRDAR